MIFNRAIFKSFPKISRLLSHYEIQHNTPQIVKTLPIPMALYGGRHTVTMLPGVILGPELMNYVIQAFKFAKVPVDFEIKDIDPDRHDNSELDDAIVSIRRNGVAIKGSCMTHSHDLDTKLPDIAIRKELDLFVYVLRCKTYPGVPAKHKNVDIVIIRQNTKGEYSLLEHQAAPGVVESLRVASAQNFRRLARYAFEYAKQHSRRSVTTIHKADVLTLIDGLFVEIARQVAKEYPDIQHNDLHVDTCCSKLVLNPHQFDVIFTSNLYGSIIANCLAGLTGGSGLMSGKNYGDQYAVFETGTRSLPKTSVEKNTVNPVAILNAAVDLLYHLGHTEYAIRFARAITKTICDDQVRTVDIGGTASSTQVLAKILDNY